jgi:hypothetical protein
MGFECVGFGIEEAIDLLDVTFKQLMAGNKFL